MKKNVLIIHADELRYDCLGCNGNEFVKTPNIDKLAKEGTVFSRHISAHPVCMPSRASLFTGLYPPAHNVWGNGVPLARSEYQKNYEDKVQFDIPTMADMFSEAGYDTASFGKLHLTPTFSHKEFGCQEALEVWKTGSLDDWHGSYYGFNHVEITKGHGEKPCHVGHYSNWLKENHPNEYKSLCEVNQDEIRPYKDFENLYPLKLSNELHHSAYLADRFSEYINEKSDEKPFFTFVGFPDPHHPYTPTEEILEMFINSNVKMPVDINSEVLKKSKLYEYFKRKIVNLNESMDEERIITSIKYTYAMIYQVDLAVGKMIDKLKEKGLYDDTIIIFTSDHGDYLGDFGLMAKTYIGSDALLHIPLIMRAPRFDLPKIVTKPNSNCDIMPTLAYMTGVDLIGEVQGQNILDIIKEDKENICFAYCMGGSESDYNNISAYDEKYRLTYFPRLDHIELYDHSNDPNELVNLKDNKDHQQIQNKLLNAIKDNYIKHSNPRAGKIARW